MRIRRVIERLCRNAGDLLVLNIGSGGETYGQVGQIHLDLMIERLPPQKSVAADAEMLPVNSAAVDIIICVGSVINHVVPEMMIVELGRVLKPGGRLILEFDSTDGLHHAFRSTSGSPEAAVQTFYNSRRLIITEYSCNHITQLLMRSGFRLERIESFHVISSLALALRLPPGLAAAFAVLDNVISRFDKVRLRGSNIVITGRRS